MYKEKWMPADLVGVCWLFCFWNSSQKWNSITITFNFKAIEYISKYAFWISAWQIVINTIQVSLCLHNLFPYRAFFSNLYFTSKAASEIEKCSEMPAPMIASHLHTVDKSTSKQIDLRPLCLLLISYFIRGFFFITSMTFWTTLQELHAHCKVWLLWPQQLLYFIASPELGVVLQLVLI